MQTSRVKQRQEVRQKNNDTRQNSPEADRKRKWEEDSSNKKAASGSDSKKKKSDIFISSLFRKNPEIPAVPRFVIVLFLCIIPSVHINIL